MALGHRRTEQSGALVTERSCSCSRVKLYTSCRHSVPLSKA